MSALAEPAPRRAHLNLVESSRLLFGLDPGAEVEEGEGWLLGAGSADNPLISNAAFRLDDGLEPAELISRARKFFGERGRGFTLWGRSGVREDRELIATAEGAGLRNAYEMPEMTLAGRAAEGPLAEGVEIRRLDSAGEAASTGGSRRPPTRASGSRPRSSATTRGSSASPRRAGTRPPSSPGSTAPRSASR